MIEHWKPVVGWEQLYEVSNLGGVRSVRRQSSVSKNRFYGGKQVKSILGSRGYLVVNLTGHGKRKQVFLHKLVLEAFVGTRPEGMEACHNDGNRCNPSIDNLRWDTRSANHQDKHKHGTAQIGERANNSKLTEHVVRIIRQSKITAAQASRSFGLSKTNAKRIVRGDTWRHVL
jgi:hypothetical protein